MRIIDIMEDVMSSIFSAARPRKTYIRYVTVARMMINHQDTLVLLLKLVEIGPALRTLRITHLDSPVLYSSFEEHILLMTQNGDTFVRKANKLVPIHRKFYYRHGKALRHELYVRHL